MLNTNKTMVLFTWLFFFTCSFQLAAQISFNEIPKPKGCWYEDTIPDDCLKLLAILNNFYPKNYRLLQLNTTFPQLVVFAMMPNLSSC